MKSVWLEAKIKLDEPLILVQSEFSPERPEHPYRPRWGALFPSLKGISNPKVHRQGWCRLTLWHHTTAQAALAPSPHVTHAWPESCDI